MNFFKNKIYKKEKQNNTWKVDCMLMHSPYLAQHNPNRQLIRHNNQNKKKDILNAPYHLLSQFILFYLFSVSCFFRGDKHITQL